MTLPPTDPASQDIVSHENTSSYHPEHVTNDTESPLNASNTDAMELPKKSHENTSERTNPIATTTNSRLPTPVFSSYGSNSGSSTDTTPEPVIVTPGIASYISFLTSSNFDTLLARVNTKLDNHSILLAQGKALLSRIETLKSRNTRLQARNKELKVEFERLMEDEEALLLLTPEQETRMVEDAESVKQETEEVKASFAGLAREWMGLVEGVVGAVSSP